MDEIDAKIIDILREDARTPNSEIARQVKLTEGAIRNRIKRLMQRSVIRRFTVETYREQVEAIVLIKIQPKKTREILKRIRRHGHRVFETSGEYDAAAYLIDEDIDSINSIVDKIRAIDGVIATTTLLKIAEEPQP